MSDLSNNFPMNASPILGDSTPTVAPAAPMSPGSVSMNPVPDDSVQPPSNLQGISSDEVHVDGDILSVPQEPVGFDLSAISASDAGISPSSSVPPVLSSDDVAATDDAAITDDAASRDDATDEAAAQDEKSPLDILEEILAGAEAEKKSVEDEKKQKEDEEAAFQAQLAVKAANYQVQADAKLVESRQIVEEAKQQRVQVDQQLQEQGKLDAPVDSGGDEFAIRQLEHVRPE